jgi:NAD(P)-dependent dehydrogenase (short-subunit alcohol dehydrogenase family)
MPPSKVYIFGPNSSISRTVDEELTKSNYEVIWLGTKSPEWMIRSKSQFKKIDYEGTRILEHCKEFLFDATNIIFLGAPIQNSMLHNTSISDIEKVIDGILTTPLKVLTFTIPNMIKRRSGRVIFIGSSIADRGVVGAAAYSASKSSYKNLVKSLAKEYGSFGITFNCLSLGYLETGMAEELNADKKKEYLSRTSNKKIIDQSEIARWLMNILQSEGLNGSTIELDGGFI